MKLIKQVICLLFMLVISLNVVAQEAEKCNCSEIISFLADKISKDYSGFTTKVNTGNRPLYNRILDSVSLKAKRTDNIDSCYLLTKRLTGFFKDLHLRTQYKWQYRDKYPERMLALKRQLKISDTSTPRVNTKTTMLTLDEKTLLLCLPSFQSEQKPIIDSILNAYKSRLAKIPNLVIDLRDNDGGYDYTYSNLLPYINKNPYLVHYYEILASDDAIELYESSRDNAQLNQATRDYFARAVEIMKVNKGKFVSLSGKRIDTIKTQNNSNYPLRVAIITNRGTMSAAENLVAIARQSKRVTVFGDNTGGAIDYTEVLWLDVPAFPDLQLIVPVQRSTRLPEQPLDNVGFAPDVRLTSNEDAYKTIQKWLNGKH
ncbi:S41 family peptidase [Mucilaginibacter sp. RS28]|uniref:S41 family peptidase n=1 Tax=Mucilaginibacter straminoryzae TaxID=2932774 RepID=A0A9X2B9Z0_9SPHI|nr:S41 family peptidase [Mucilaginibacter straminoryzae]MCJ8211199.1 S41 family peptidase [Mucilaginibacter straminoryzae]